MEEFLKSIRPDLTLYGVLVTFSVISFLVGKYFWKFEGQLRRENIERLMDLMGGFRRTYIEPFLMRQMIEGRKNAYSNLVNGLLVDIYEKERAETREVQYKLVNVDKLKDIINESALKRRIDQLGKADEEVIEQFFISASGDELFDKLDHQYENKYEISIQYHKACRACKHLSYAFFFLALSLITGVSQIFIYWDKMVFFFWIFVSLEALAYGIYSFIKLEYYRSKLIRTWEDLQIYGKI
jgi:hypothetical protein